MLTPASATTVAGAVAAGVALAACSGLRAFLPIFLVALAARVLHWPLAPEVAWLDSDLVLLGLAVATAAEVAADKIPLLDHGLDALHTVLGPAAAVLASVSAWSHLAPEHAVLVALLAGAPVALGVHALSAVARVKATTLSGGAANPVLSVGEDAVTVAGVSVAVLAPIVLAVGLAGVLVFLVGWAVRSVLKRRRPRLEVGGETRQQ
jgi:hypothetical protein